MSTITYNTRNNDPFSRTRLTHNDMTMTVYTFGQEAYAQLRRAAKTSVDVALTNYDAHRYEWMDDEEKEDIVSDAVTKALGTFDERGGCSFKSWVKRLAYQLTIDRLNAHRETVGTSYITDDGDEIEIPELGDSTTPEDVVIGWEKQKAVEDTIFTRSDIDGRIFDLHVMGYQPREIAARLGLTPNAVSVRLDRMKKAVTRSVAA